MNWSLLNLHSCIVSFRLSVVLLRVCNWPDGIIKKLMKNRLVTGLGGTSRRDLPEGVVHASWDSLAARSLAIGVENRCFLHKGSDRPNKMKDH